MRQGRPGIRASIVASALAVGCFAAPVAQENGEIEEIIVTATKRAQDVRTVPIAVSVLTQDDFAVRNARNAADIEQGVIGMSQVTPTGEAMPVFAMRGVTNKNFLLSFSQPIALYVDETYKGLPAFSSNQIFDLERVEILRGPQGTLFGRNATGGAVSLVTRKPDVDAGFSGNVMAGYGRFDRIEYGGAFNVPIKEGELAARVAVSGTVADGFVKALEPGVPDHMDLGDHGVRALLAYEPNDDLDVLFRYSYSKIDMSGISWHWGDIGPGGINFTGEFNTDVGFFESREGTNGLQKSENHGFGLTINYDVTDAISLTSVTSYDFGDYDFVEGFDGLPEVIFNIETYADDMYAFSQDIRLTSTTDGPFQWLIGAYYYVEDIDSNFYFDLAPLSTSLGSYWGQKTESYAFYSHNTYNLTDRLKLIGGIRYSNEEVSLSDFYGTASLVGIGAGGTINRTFLANLFTFDQVPQTKLDVDDVSYKAGLSYDFDGNTFAYAHVSTGFRAPVFGAGAFSAAETVPADKETLDAYELGVKTSLFDGKMDVNLAAFFYDYEGLQFFQPQGPAFLLKNAESAETHGVEVETVTKFNSSFRVRLAGSYLNAEFKDTILNEGDPNQADISGNKIYWAPTWTATGGIDWTLMTNDWGRVDLSTASKYTSKIYFTELNVETLSESGYMVHDARLTYTTADDKFSLSLWGTNLSNKKYTTQRGRLAAFNNANSEMRGRSREWGVQVSMNF